MATTIKVRDLRAGMKVKDGRALRTVTAIQTITIDGSPREFPDYEVCYVYLDFEVWAPGRGKVRAHAQFDPDETITIYEEAAAHDAAATTSASVPHRKSLSVIGGDK